MPSAPEMVLTGGTIVTRDGVHRADIAIRDGTIAAIGREARGGHKLDITGLTVLPGVIDSQVHFREPGYEQKETLESGTRAALLGGVCSVFEMPNTSPPTTTAEALDDKFRRARGRAWVDHAFFIGASPDNIEELAELERLPGLYRRKDLHGQLNRNPVGAGRQVACPRHGIRDTPVRHPRRR